VLETLALPLNEIRLIGGGARDPLWAQIVCDVMGCAVTRPAHSDASVGAAMLAGVGAGFFASERAAAECCVNLAGQLQPRPGEAELYTRLFARYRKVHDVLAEIYREGDGTAGSR